MSRETSPVAPGIKVAVAALAIGVGIWFLFRVSDVLFLALFAMVLAAGLDPIVERAHSWRLPPGGWRIPRWLAILTLLLGLVFLLTGLLLLLAWTAWSEGSRVWVEMPQSEQAILVQLDRLREFVPGMPTGDEILAILRSQLQEVGSYLRSTMSMVFTAVGVLSSALLVLVMVLYMLLDKDTLHTGFLALIPPSQQGLVDETAREALRTMGGWLRGQVVLVMLMGTVIGVTMALFGMPYPVLMGLIGALGELVPMVGPIAAAVLVVPVSMFTQPPGVTVSIAVFFLVLSVVEGNYIVPKVMEASVKLPPFFTVLVVLLGAALLGIPGALLAIPLSAGLRVVLRRIVVPAIQAGNPNPRPRAERRTEVASARSQQVP